jgi:hypothetical protein
MRNHTAAESLRVLEGSVDCPVQGGPVDVERCLACPRVGEITTDGGIVCAAAAYAGEPMPRGGAFAIDMLELQYLVGRRLR